jgi:branched-subunit amino acid ABC-type transport system permease component
VVDRFKFTTTGMAFASIRSSEPAALTVGISTVKGKLLVFAASAFVAGLGGAMFASVVGRATAGSFSVLVGIVWLAIVVTWGVRSVLGALMAGVIFGLLQQRLILLLIFLVVTIAAGLIVQMILSKRYKTPVGLITIIVVTALSIGVIEWLWNVKGGDVQDQNIWAAHALLLGVWVGPMIGGLVFLVQKHNLHRKPLGILALIAYVALIVAGAIVVLSADLSDSALDVPTMMFGLGAVFLARQPRGVIYDMVNRQRLMLLHDQERRREVELAKAAGPVPA